MHINSKKNQLLHLMTSPPMMLTAVVSGLILGWKYKNLADCLGIIGKSYFGLLVALLLPLVIALVISRLANLMKHGIAFDYLKKIALVFIISAILVSIISTLAAELSGNLLQLTPEKQTRLAMSMEKIGVSWQLNPTQSSPLIDQSSSDNYKNSSFSLPSSITASNNNYLDTSTLHSTLPTYSQKTSFILQMLLPQNIFYTLIEGLTFKTIFISFIIGLALTTINTKAREHLILSFQAILQVFDKLYKSALCFLPIGMCFLIAKGSSELDLDILKILAFFIALIYFIGLSFCVLYITIIKLATKNKISLVLKTLSSTILVAFFTISSFIALPAAIEALKKLRCDHQLTDLLLPLGVTINRHGKIFLLTMVTLFVAHFYHLHLGIGYIVLMIMLTAALGATALANGIMLTPTLAIIAMAIRIPIEIGILIIVITDFFTAGIISLITVLASCATTALIAKNKSMAHDYNKMELSQ